MHQTMKFKYEKEDKKTKTKKLEYEKGQPSRKTIKMKGIKDTTKNTWIEMIKLFSDFMLLQNFMIIWMNKKIRNLTNKYVLQVV